MALGLRLEEGEPLGSLSDGEDVNGSLGPHVSFGISVTLLGRVSLLSWMCFVRAKQT